MYGVAISFPKFNKKFIAGGNNIRYPNKAPHIKASILIGNKIYKYFFSFEDKPGDKNIVN